MIKKVTLNIIFGILFISNLIGQNNQLGNWFIYFGNQKINKSWNFQSDIQLRNYKFLDQRNQFLIRGGIGYNLQPNNHNILLGAAYVESNNYDENDIVTNISKETRIFEQYIIKKALNDYFFTNRFRFEQRFFPNEFGLRGRYFVSINKPIGQKDIRNRTFYSSLYNELFIDIKNLTFDRNRFYVGLGYGITQNVRIESGYMIQSQKNINRSQLQFILINNFSFNNNL